MRSKRRSPSQQVTTLAQIPSNTMCLMVRPHHACFFWRDSNPRGQDLDSQQVPQNSSSTEIIMSYDKQPYVIRPTNWGYSQQFPTQVVIFSLLSSTRFRLSMISSAYLPLKRF